MSEHQSGLFGDQVPEGYDPKFDERSWAREHMADKRKKSRDIEIPPIKDPARRALATAGVEAFGRTYFPGLVDLELSTMHREIIAGMERNLISGGSKSIAAPRGTGKTTWLLIAILWALCSGVRRYAVIVGASQGVANSRIDDLKFMIETGDPRTGINLLGEDFPEVVAPIVALEGSVQRRHLQTVKGRRTDITWTLDEIKLPTVDGSQASGAIVKAAGLDGTIRGLVTRGLRPDIVMIDDPQTTESARSVTLTEKREEILRKDIEGLRGPGQPLSLFGLWTVIRKGDLADTYTDREKVPAHQGQRYRAIQEFPANRKILDEYIEIRLAGFREGDSAGRAAHLFYLQNRDDIEAGSVMTWPANFDPSPVTQEEIEESGIDPADVPEDLREDFHKRQVSALQRCLDFVAGTSKEAPDWSAFNAEFQNQPDDQAEEETIFLSAKTIQNRTSGHPRGVVPDDTRALLVGIDVGRYRLHWVVSAYLEGRRAAVIDYGIHEVNSPTGDTRDDTPEAQALKAAVQIAVRLALSDLWEAMTDPARGYAKADGTPVPVDLVGIDSRYQQGSVFEFCATDPATIYPMIGQGSAPGLTRYRVPKGSIKSEDGRIYYRPTDKPRRYYLDTDNFKAAVHEGFLLDAGPGSIAVFEPEDERTHHAYARHVTAEVQTVIKGVPKWVKTRGQKSNHWFDATYLTQAAASVVQHWIPEIALEPTSAPSTEKKKSPRRRRRRKGSVNYSD